jgi:hypothetical protein
MNQLVEIPPILFAQIIDEKAPIPILFCFCLGSLIGTSITLILTVTVGLKLDWSFGFRMDSMVFIRQALSLFL